MKVQWKRIWKIIAPYVIECLIESLSLLKKGDKKEGDGISVPSPRSFALLYYMSEKLRSMWSS